MAFLRSITVVAGLRSMMMVACLRSTAVAGLRSMIACSRPGSRTAVSSKARVKDDGGVLEVDSGRVEVNDNGGLEECSRTIGGGSGNWGAEMVADG
jgi:hypothetical protein